jgi:hypothetical protein
MAARKLRVVLLLCTCFSVLPNGYLPGQTRRSEKDSARQLMVGIIKDRSGFDEGGCELLLPRDSYTSERYVFLSDLQGRAVMNLGGLDIRLTLARPEESGSTPPKGDLSRHWYRGKNLQVRVDYTVSGLCPPDDESCEVIYYDAEIHLVSGRSQWTLAAHGLCGT